MNKLCDEDFINYIQNFHVILLCESWHNKSSIIDIDEYTCYSCPRPKYNRRAKRDSGGLVVYCKSYLADGISIVKRDDKGIFWIKLDKLFFKLESDVYICLCYIPPENSRLYTSHLRDFDYF